MESTYKIRNHTESKFKVNGGGNYLTVIPGTEDYKQFLKDAIICKDIDTLSRVKDNTDKPVHIIDAFEYAKYLDTVGCLSSDVIIVTRGLFRRWYRLEDGRNFDWQGIERPFPKGQGGWVETGVYKTHKEILQKVHQNMVAIEGTDRLFLLPDNGRD